MMLGDIVFLEPLGQPEGDVFPVMAFWALLLLMIALADRWATAPFHRKHPTPNGAKRTFEAMLKAARASHRRVVLASMTLLIFGVSYESTTSYRRAANELE